MTISDVLNTAAAGLAVNADRVGAAADNIANALTPGYRSVDVQSVSVTTESEAGSGSVRSQVRQLVDVAALLAPSPSRTDLAIAGDGFFAVQAQDGTAAFTRDGSFQTDENGVLTNAGGFSLLGFPTDADGTVTAGNLEPVRVAGLSGTPEPTTTVAVSGNLPADAPVGTQFDVTTEVFDAQGSARQLTLSFTRLDSPGAFQLDVADPVSAQSGVQVGTATDSTGDAYSLVVNFANDGSVIGLDVDGDGTVDLDIPPALTLKGLGLDEPEQQIQIVINGSGESAALTSFAGSDTAVATRQDGNSAGQLAGVEVTRDGTVIAAFETGERRAVYQIPVAEFTNPNGLQAVSGNAFIETTQSGQANLTTGGGDDRVTIVQSAIEGSNTDIGSEFARLILADTAYRANVNVLRAAEQQSRQLINLEA